MDYIIIVAGGKGLRMGGDIPKQFMEIGGEPVLMRTLKRFREYSEKLNIINKTTEKKINIYLSNSIGFGGTNSALVIKKI